MDQRCKNKVNLMEARIGKTVKNRSRQRLYNKTLITKYYKESTNEMTSN